MAKQLDGPVPAVSEAFRHLDWGSQNVASHVGVELRKLARYLAAHAEVGLGSLQKSIRAPFCSHCVESDMSKQGDCSA